MNNVWSKPKVAGRWEQAVEILGTSLQIMPATYTDASLFVVCFKINLSLDDPPRKVSCLLCWDRDEKQGRSLDRASLHSLTALAYGMFPEPD